MFIRSCSVIFLKPNIGNRILKQSHNVSFSSVYSVSKHTPIKKKSPI